MICVEIGKSALEYATIAEMCKDLYRYDELPEIYRSMQKFVEI